MLLEPVLSFSSFRFIGGLCCKENLFFKVSEFILRHFENDGANNAFNKIMFNLLKYNLVSGILSMYVLGYYDR